MSFLVEMVDRLVARGVGTVGTNIFRSSQAAIPPGDGPYVLIIETGGAAPTRVQNSPLANTERPTAQITVRASKYENASTKAMQAYLALDGIFNTTLSGTFYQSVKARQGLTDLGLDDLNRPLIGFNIEAEKSPS